MKAMEEVIEYILALGFKLTFEKEGYNQMRIGLEKEFTIDGHGSVLGYSQVIPPENFLNFGPEYLRNVSNFIIDKINADAANKGTDNNRNDTSLPEP